MFRSMCRFVFRLVMGVKYRGILNFQISIFKTQIVSSGVHQFIYRLYDEHDSNYSESGLPAEIERFSEHAPDLIQTYSPYLREASPEF